MFYLAKILSLLFFVYNLQQQDEVIKVKVVDIIETNEFIVEDEESRQHKVLLAETKPCSDASKKNEAIDYISNKIYRKKVYVIIDKKIESYIIGSIIYDCEKLKDSFDNNMPCASASPLDLELIKLGYVIYLGNNAFLKRLASEN